MRSTLRRAVLVGLALLVTGPAAAQDEPGPPAAAPDSPALVAAADLDLRVQSAARMGNRQGVLVAVTAENHGGVDLLLLLSEAHVVPPDSMEANCSPTSPRFPTIPVLQITRSEAIGVEECEGSQRVPKADWVLSVMRLPAGGSATVVLQVTEQAEWSGDLHAHLGISYTSADRATARELKRTEKIGLGMMIVGLEPGGRVVSPGEGGPAIQRAVELFDRRAVAAPIVID